MPEGGEPPMPDVTSYTAVPTTTLSPICHCGHDIRDHDAIGGRFCRATQAAEITRTCVCVGVTPREQP
jgi:hypothetical protein